MANTPNLSAIYGVEIYMRDDVQSQFSDSAVLELDLIQVRAGEKPLKIYTVIGDREVANSAAFQQWQAAHNSMLAAYRIADWSCAAQDCRDAAALAPPHFNPYYNIYRKRIIHYTITPPPEGWCGISPLEM